MGTGAGIMSSDAFAEANLYKVKVLYSGMLYRAWIGLKSFHACPIADTISISGSFERQSCLCCLHAAAARLERC